MGPLISCVTLLWEGQTSRHGSSAPTRRETLRGKDGGTAGAVVRFWSGSEIVTWQRRLLRPYRLAADRIGAVSVVRTWSALVCALTWPKLG